MAAIPRHRARLEPGENNDYLWFEYEVQVGHTHVATKDSPGSTGLIKIIRELPDGSPAGRTGKGLVHFWATGKQGTGGGRRVVDVEDIVFISHRKQAG